MGTHQRRKGFAVLLGWFFLMYLANAWMPLYRDDYLAALVWKTGDHIQSLGDVFHSLGRYYMMHGGRLVSFFVQFFFVFLGKFWFNIANAFAFAAMCAVLLMHCRRRLAFADESEMLLVMGAFLWLGLSHFGEVAIWLCGSAVYLWTGLLAAIFLLPYNLADAGRWRTWPLQEKWMLPLGAMAACSVENLTVTTTALAGWLSYRAFCRGRYEAWMGRGAIGACLGSVVCLVAPGNYVRIEEDNDRSWLFHFLNEIPANLEMVMYLLPILLTVALAWRMLRLETAGRRGTLPLAVKARGRHRVLLGTLAVVTVSFFTTGFFYRTLEWLVVHGVFFPLGLTEEVLLSHFNNTMQGLEEALIYLLGTGFVYLSGCRAFGLTKSRMAALGSRASARAVMADFPELRYAAFFVLLCLANNLLMLGAPSFPGRALFSSSVMLIMGAVVVLRIPVVRERFFDRPEGSVFRRGGILILGFVVVATLGVLHSIWQEDAVRIGYIAGQAALGEKVVSLPPSAIPERRRVLRHIAYDDFDAGMTREYVCAYFGIDDIRLVPGKAP